jgi:hypothetical protein
MNKAGKAIEENKKLEEGANSKEHNEILEKLLSGEDIFETIDTPRGQFVMKYPRPRTLRQIQVLLAQRFEGTDLSKLPERTVRFYELYATLDVVVVKAPKWWDDLDSAEDCPDDQLAGDLYRRYLRFYNRIQSEIAGTGTQSRDSPEGSVTDDKEASLGDGAFSGLAHGQPVPGVDRRAD